MYTHTHYNNYYYDDAIINMYDMHYWTHYNPKYGEITHGGRGFLSLILVVKREGYRKGSSQLVYISISYN
jgi:hypothetical protein